MRGRVCRLFLAAAVVRLCAAETAAEQIEFFEKRIRPVLARSCYACHSGAIAAPMGGLRVDTREGLLQGGKRGPAQNLLLEVLDYKHAVKMPPTGKLPDEQIADIAAWVKMGTPYAPPANSYAARRDKLWSLQPVRDTHPPTVKRKGWVRSPLDAFLLARLEAKGLTPAPPADKLTLLRRVTYDLTGLPPTPAEIDAYQKDQSPDAFRRVVDRLLASPHYGERWARHWLDLVRYAETNGHEFDNEKLAPWRYRDYVIRAFNDDVPYDQLVREHIAGDLLPRKRQTPDGAYQESPVATSFFWFGEVLNSATDPVKSRADEVDNQIDVAGKAFLGLTVACARCHDHKFDPIPTADYYAVAGVLHSTDIREGVIDSPERAQKIAELSEQIRAIRPVQPAPRAAVRYRPEDAVFANFEQGFGDWRTSGAAFADAPVNGAASSLAAGSDRFVGTLTSPKFRTSDKLYLHVRVSGSKGDSTLSERGPLRFTLVNAGFKAQHVVPDGTPGSKWKRVRLVLERNRICWFEIVDHSRDGHIAVEQIVFSDSPEPPPTDEPAPVPPRELPPLDAARIAALEAQIPESAFAMMAADYEPHNVKLHIRGNHATLGDEVPRGLLRLVANEKTPRQVAGSGRLEFAEWIASSSNPLTARVMVNRIWKHHFGRGLVRTPDNFGVMGEAPTHPELLDYLAARFIEGGWSIKNLHRQILLSSAYAMSSRAPEQAAAVDPENKLLSHMPVRRLEAEAIRDSILSVSGTLDPKLFGPSIVPYISAYQDGRGKPKSGPLDGNGRRSIYLQVRRNFLPSIFMAFDYPLPISAMGSRGVSTVPSQALLMLNNEFVAEQASKWAARSIETAADPRERVRALYRSAFTREPEPSETGDILDFVAKHKGDERAAWTDVAHVLLNSPEFLYLR
jgi:hypothetical protein